MSPKNTLKLARDMFPEFRFKIPPRQKGYSQKVLWLAVSYAPISGKSNIFCDSDALNIDYRQFSKFWTSYTTRRMIRRLTKNFRINTQLSARIMPEW